jgi:hypothetical protein
MREVRHCRDACVLSEAKRQVVVPARLEQGERALEMIARLFVLSTDPKGCSNNAMRDAGLG